MICLEEDENKIKAGLRTRLRTVQLKTGTEKHTWSFAKPHLCANLEKKCLQDRLNCLPHSFSSRKSSFKSHIPSLCTVIKVQFIARTTDTQWRHESKISEKLGRCGRQNMLPQYLKIWDWDWIFGRAVKAISSLGVRSPCCNSSCRYSPA